MKEKILLAESDGAVRRMVARVLDLAGYTVTLAGTAEEALSFFRAERPDLVVLNLELAEAAGEFLQQMNRLDASAPVLALTAGADQLEQAVQRGIDALMEKPLELPLLLQTIDRLLARRRCSSPEQQPH